MEFGCKDKLGKLIDDIVHLLADACIVITQTVQKDFGMNHWIRNLLIIQNLVQNLVDSKFTLMLFGINVAGNVFHRKLDRSTIFENPSQVACTTYDIVSSCWI